MNKSWIGGVVIAQDGVDLSYKNCILLGCSYIENA